MYFDLPLPKGGKGGLASNKRGGKATLAGNHTRHLQKETGGMCFDAPKKCTIAPMGRAASQLVSCGGGGPASKKNGRLAQRGKELD